MRGGYSFGAVFVGDGGADDVEARPLDVDADDDDVPLAVAWAFDIRSRIA